MPLGDAAVFSTGVRGRPAVATGPFHARADADSLEEAGDRLSTFTRLPRSQWRSVHTTNVIE